MFNEFLQENNINKWIHNRDFCFFALDVLVFFCSLPDFNLLCPFFTTGGTVTKIVIL
jgi:hypothetical protein